MSKKYISSANDVHQQQGGMSTRDFAALHDLKLCDLNRLLKLGKVLGASRHPLSKRWWIFPPAKLLDDSYRQQRKAVTKTPGGYLDESPMDLPDLLPGTDGFDFGISPHGLPADGLPPVQETREAPSLAPPAKPVLLGQAAKRGFNAVERCAEVGAVAPIPKQRAAGLPEVYALFEVKSIRRVLHDAAARMHREGIHYLRLEGREFSQLYAALDSERSRIRKLVGKGLVDVGNLRASDSVWQKLQAMCHEGRLL